MKHRRAITLFNLFSFFNQLDFYVPIKVVYFHLLTGSYATASTIISVVWIAQALCEIPTGIFSDLIGRKRTIVLGSVLSLGAYLLYAWNGGYLILLLGSALEGGARALFSGNNNAYLHNLLRAEHKEGAYPHYYGRLNGLIGLAMVAAAVGSTVLLQWSPHLFMWINVLPQLVTLICALLLTEVRQGDAGPTVYRHLGAALSEMRGNLNLRYLSLAQILGGGGLASYEYQAAVYAAVWPVWAIGLARAIQEGGVIPSFYFAGPIIDRLGYVRVLAADRLVGTLGIVLAVLSRSALSPFFIMLSLPFYGAGDSANQHLMQQELTERQRATIASLNSFGNSLTFALCLYLCGLIANAHGPFLALLATQVLQLPSAYYQFKFLWRLKRHMAVSQGH